MDCPLTLIKRFKNPLSPKWNHEENDGELIDDAGRFGKNKHLSKQNYEDGMARVFVSCHAALNADGRLVIVFANKQPEAWETLVAAIIKAGFVVDGSWPIATEMQNRTRAFVLCRARLLCLARLQKTLSRSTGGLGQYRTRTNARESHHANARVLGRKHSRAGLRVGSNRPGDGGLQPTSRVKKAIVQANSWGYPNSCATSGVWCSTT